MTHVIALRRKFCESNTYSLGRILGINQSKIQIVSAKSSHINLYHDSRVLYLISIYINFLNSCWYSYVPVTFRVLEI